MPINSKETLNPHLRRTYRVLVPTFDALVKERFATLNDTELAHQLNIEIKTLQSIRDGNMIYGETIRKVSEALKVPVYGFAENQAVIDPLAAILDAASDSTTELSRWPLIQLFQKAHHLLRRIHGQWHWSDRVHDDLRPYRRVFGEDKSVLGFGIFEVEFEGPILDAVLSYELVAGPLIRGRSAAMFGLFIDYGRLFKRRQESAVWSLETWIHRSIHKHPPGITPNKALFITWIDRLVGDLLIRSRSPFTITFKGMISGNEGDRQLLLADDPLVGYQRWVAHQAALEPWILSEDEHTTS